MSLPTEEDKDRIILSLKENIEHLENKNKILKEENTSLKHRLIKSRASVGVLNKEYRSLKI